MSSTQFGKTTELTTKNVKRDEIILEKNIFDDDFKFTFALYRFHTKIRPINMLGTIPTIGPIITPIMPYVGIKIKDKQMETDTSIMLIFSKVLVSPIPAKKLFII